MRSPSSIDSSKTIPRLFDNYIRVEHLDPDAAREAIEAPLEVYNTRVEPSRRVTIEPKLVDEVLTQVRTGEVELEQSGRGTTAGPADAEHTTSNAIETPYLQLVMTRLWTEMGNDSRILRFESLVKLGGAQEIVRTHLDTALEGQLDERERDQASDLFHHLVTPSGTKIAHSASDLADYTGIPAPSAMELLKKLAGPDVRIIREIEPPDHGEESRFEIFHDALAAPILDWRARHTAVRFAHERRRARIFRGMAIVSIALLVVAVTVVVVTLVRHADQATATAQSRLLARRAEAAVDPEQASLSALEAYRRYGTEEAQAAILQVAGSYELGRPFATTEGGVADVAWSPDRTTVATAGGDGAVALWDVGSHQELARIPPPTVAEALRGVAHLGVIGINTGAVAFSHHGRQLAYAENVEYYDSVGNPQVLATVRLWDVGARIPVRSFSGPKGRINALAFSPDGAQLAAASSDTKVWLWDVSGRRPARGLKGHVGAVNAVAFSPDGRRLASSSCDAGDHDNHEDTHDDSVLLWNPRRGRLLAHLPGQSPVCGVAFSPDGKTLAAAGDNEAITLWGVKTRQRIGLPLVGHTDVLNGVAFSPDGQTLASASRDHSVRLWSVAQHRQVGAPLTHVGDVNSVDFSPDGHTLASAGSDGVRVWRVAGPYALGVLPAGAPNALSVAFSPDDRTVAWTDDHAPTSKSGKTSPTVYLWDTSRQRVVETISAPTDNVNSLAFGPGGRMLAWAAEADHSVWIWNVQQDRRIQRIPAPNGNTFIERVAISPDGSTVAFDDLNGLKDTIRLWDVRHRRYLMPLQIGKTGGLGGLAFSPNGEMLASAGFDGNIRLWNLGDDRQVAAMHTGGNSGMYDVAFSPDGKDVASAGGDGEIRFWDVAHHSELGLPLTGDTAAVYTVGFSHDGTTLASASLDDTVRLWNVSARLPELTLTGHTSYAYGVALSPDGRMLASGGGDGTVRLWGNFSLGAAISRLCSYIDKRTAPVLWRQIEPSIGYRQPC